MKKLTQNIKKEKGFTLLELIITLTIVAILASFLVTFMGTAITRSADPIEQIRNLGASNMCMESVSAAYGAYMSSGRTSTEWNAFKTTCNGVACGGNKVCSTVASGSGIYSPNFETIQVTITTAGQKIVSYFIQ